MGYGGPFFNAPDQKNSFATLGVSAGVNNSTYLDIWSAYIT